MDSDHTQFTYMKNTNSKYQREDDILNVQKSCVRFLCTSEDLKKQKGKKFEVVRGSQVLLGEIGQFPRVKVQLCDQPLPFPELHAQFLDIEYDMKNTMDDLCSPNDIVGIIGSARPVDVHMPSAAQIISISKRSELNNLHALRPYGFSKVLVSNGFEEYGQKAIFQLEQELMVMVQEEKLDWFLHQWEQYLQEVKGNTVICGVLKKLMVRISRVGDRWWVGLNSSPVESYYWGNIGLCAEKDTNMIKQVLYSFTLNQLFELIQYKKQKSCEQCRAYINSILEQRGIKRSKIPQNPSSKSSQKKYNSPQQSPNQNESGSDNFDLLMPLEEVYDEYDEYDLPERKYRSQSADITDEAFQQLMTRKHLDSDI